MVNQQKLIHKLLRRGGPRWTNNNADNTDSLALVDIDANSQINYKNSFEATKFFVA